MRCKINMTLRTEDSSLVFASAGLLLNVQSYRVVSGTL